MSIFPIPQVQGTGNCKSDVRVCIILIPVPFELIIYIVLAPRRYYAKHSYTLSHRNVLKSKEHSDLFTT